MFFIGNDKGRRCVIEKIYQEGIKRGVLCDFTLNCVFDMEQKDGIKYNNYVEYQNVVNNILYSNCILEVVQPGQNGVTLRYYEAVCYNKKLLTNNKEIVHYPYYDRRYMKIFDSIEEIDYDWIIQEDNIQYNYNGEFSPTMLIRDILSEE